MHGCFACPDAPAAALDADGWLRTGDLGTMNASGYCRIIGCLQAMVIGVGENPFPAETEAVPVEHPAVGRGAAGPCPRAAERAQGAALRVVPRRVPAHRLRHGAEVVRRER